MPCYVKKLPDGNMFMCGDLGPHCVHPDCMDASDNLCDYPVGNGLTCDAPICEDHSHEIGPNLHYCEAHFIAWNEFVAEGGVKRELENVVPYKKKL